VIKEAKFCHNHHVIVKFIGSKPHPNIVDCVVDVNQKVQTRKISLEMDLSRGFFMFKTNGPLPTKKKVLMFTLHKGDWGMCIYHEWIPGFDPNNPSRMKIPTRFCFISCLSNIDQLVVSSSLNKLVLC
jgi:hypothetical protein